MKKIVTALAICGLMVAGAQQSHAGDREWAVAGKVLTGVIAGAVIAKSFEPAPVVYQPAPVVYQPAPVVVQQPTVVYAQPIVQPAPVVYAPAPVVYAPAPVIVRPAHVYHAPPPVVSYHYSFGHRPRHRVCW
ncbi:MAG TPA: hypothetical protein VGH19_04355 [Verrucomicrobiae bacterium]